MRAVDVIGKRIVRVHQEDSNDAEGGLFRMVDALELEDGTIIHFKVGDHRRSAKAVLAFAAVPASGGGDRG